MTNKQLYFVPLSGAVIAVSTAAIFIRNAQNDVPSMVIATFRLSIASFLLWLFVLPSRKKVLLGILKSNYWSLIISGLLLALHFACWITSLQHTSVMSSVVLVTTTPIWVAILSPIFLKEKMSFRIGMGLIIALAGSILITMGQNCDFVDQKILCSFDDLSFSSNIIIGNMLAIFGAFAAAGYVMIGRKLRKTVDFSSYILWVYSISSVVLLFFTVLFGYKLWGYSLKAYFFMMLLAIIPQLLGHSLLNWLLGFLPAIYVAISLLGEPIGSSLLAFIFLQESPTIIEIIGACIILAGILVTITTTKSSKILLTQ